MTDKAKTPALTGLPMPLADHTGGVPARQPEPHELPEVGKVKRAWRWWLTKAAKIATVQNRVFAWMTFYLGLWPVALWFKIRRQDRLDRNPRPIGASGWNKRTDPIHTEIDRVRRPF